MKKTIDQFMWGYQEHFRIGVELNIARALSEIGMNVDVRTLLVGFATEGDLKHQVCIEPEDGPLLVEHLRNVSDRASELLKENPDSRMFHSHPLMQQKHRESLFRKARSDALEEAIHKVDVFEGLTFFASSGAPINGYDVLTCVGIPTEILDHLPTLDGSRVGVLNVLQSLQQGVIYESLVRADRALYLPDPGAGISVLGATENIVKRAAEWFVRGAGYRVGLQSVDLFSAVNSFTSRSYERAGARGKILITPREKVKNRTPVRFERPVVLTRTRNLRKLLELSDDSLSVMVDDQGAYGLGSCASGNDVVEISVVGHAEWELGIDGDLYVRVAYGKATLPRPLLNFDAFRETTEQVLGAIEFNRIWSIIQGVQQGGHGTALVVSTDPEGEANRLGAEAVSINPTMLEPHDIVRLGSVDGAVLLGTDGRCHAFGVILDGLASGEGDPARGSRYNSAVRYQRTTDIPSIIVVISDDGTIDLVPRRMPRVRREHVGEVVREFLEICESEHVDGREFSRADDLVVRYAFYLNAEQCHSLNDNYENEMRRRLESGGIQINRKPLEPHPDMNDSYFL